MIVVVFTSTLRRDLPAEEYERTGTRMFELVSAMPGFLGMDFGSREGGEILIARFESQEALAAWREEPEHRVAQQLGRERFFADYKIEVCELVREYAFDYEAGSASAR